ncbi:Methionine-binding lipoprotein MetQ [termite gut metagenome]|uniref:Methionine-binding lipoprotein MetQ n=1 Tax=termite gut metagenome TaxID=433724 RepID=A0A5J4S4W5_9ZZZZ
MKQISIFLLAVVLALFCACISKSGKQARIDSKALIIGVTQKPTYPDVITHAIKPQLEKKGYTIKLVQLDDQRVFNQTLVDGEVDINIGQHEAALNFEKANNPKWRISALITVPSAHMGIFSDKYQVKDIEELKKAVRKGDVVAMPDDVTNLSRSLIFLENTGFIKLREDKDKFATTEKDIAENYYGLEYRVLKAEQIPRVLSSIGIGLIYGDDADLLGILEQAIIREVDESDLFLNTFVVRDETLEAQPQWLKDFVEAVQSETFKNVIEDPQYRFHKYYRPSWYREKWGIANEYGK